MACAAYDSESDDDISSDNAVGTFDSLEYLKSRTARQRDAPDLWSSTSSATSKHSAFPDDLAAHIKKCYAQYLLPLCDQEIDADPTNPSCTRFSGLSRDLLDAIKVVQEVRTHIVESFRYVIVFGW